MKGFGFLLNCVIYFISQRRVSVSFRVLFTAVGKGTGTTGIKKGEEGARIRTLSLLFSLEKKNRGCVAISGRLSETLNFIQCFVVYKDRG